VAGAIRLVARLFKPPPARNAAAMAEAHGERPAGMLGDVRDAPAGRENDLEAVELARFAVAEHNSKTVRTRARPAPPFAQITFEIVGICP